MKVANFPTFGYHSTMTVGDLTEALSRYPPNSPLTVYLAKEEEWVTDVIVSEDRYGVEIRVEAPC